MLFEQMSAGCEEQIIQTSRQRAAPTFPPPQAYTKDPKDDLQDCTPAPAGKLKERWKPRRRQRVGHVPEKGLKLLERKRWASRANLGMHSLS